MEVGLRAIFASYGWSDVLRLQVEGKTETLKRNWAEMPPWVFCTELGTPLNESRVRTDTRVFSPARYTESPALYTLTRHNLHGYAAVAIGSHPMATDRAEWNGASMGQVACADVTRACPVVVLAVGGRPPPTSGIPLELSEETANVAVTAEHLDSRRASSQPRTRATLSAHP